MKELLRETLGYRRILADARAGRQPHTALILFSDAAHLRSLLKECAKAFFLAEEGSRTALLIEKESFPDCLFFPQAGAKLTVDDAARILEESLLRSVEGEKKLFVLDAFHTAGALVQNKLLKVLEEPPEGVSFLLGAAQEHAVLPTVLSRTEKFREPPFAEESVLKALYRMYPAEKGAERAAAASGGILSQAERLLAGGGESFRLAEEFLLGDAPEAFCRRADKLDKDAFFAALELLLRDMLFLKTGQERFSSRTDGSARTLAERYPAGVILSALEGVREAQKRVNFNAGLGQTLYALALSIKEEEKRWQKLSS